MTTKEIKEKVAHGIVGQGNQVDTGSVLPEVLNALAENGVSVETIVEYSQFSEEVNYKSGDIVRHDGEIYIFTKDHLFGEWEDDDARSINVQEIVGGIKITHAELKRKRDNGLLKAGEKYRITDYVATTTQADTRSANHPFDIIVEAISENALSEDAIAVQHEGDTYFAESRLGAWKIKYSIDNDTLQYAWALNEIQLESNGKYVRMPHLDENGHWAWAYFDEEDKQLNLEDCAYTDPNPAVGNPLYEGEYSSETIGDNIVAVNEGKGVIFNMVDEYDNECPYDFKGIQFLRSNGWCNDHDMFTEEVLDGEYQDYWFYTFSIFNEEKEILDASIVGNSGKYKNDEGKFNGIYGNKFGIACAYNAYYESFAYQALGNNVFVTRVDEEGFFYGCYANTFGCECYQNTFGNNCYYNTFGNGCYGNTFGNNCYQNTFGNNCYYNTFGNNCYQNTFGNNCYQNTFGNYVRQLTLFEGVIYCAITGGSSQNSFVQNAQILNGTQGKSTTNRLTISFQQNKTYTQMAGFNSGGTLTMWTPADDHQ